MDETCRQGILDILPRSGIFRELSGSGFIGFFFFCDFLLGGWANYEFPGDV